MNNEDELARIVNRVEGPIPLDPAATDRVLQRALARLEEASVNTELLAEAESTTLTAPPPGRGPSRWLAVAAALLIAVGCGAVALYATRSADEVQAPANTTDLRLDPIEESRRPRAGNWLGVTEFTGQTYDNMTGTVASASDRVILQRVGQIGEAASNESVIETRRTVRIGDRTAEPESFRLRVRADGAVEVPIQYIAPIELGGTCTGGSVLISPAATSMVTTATCNGVMADVDVRVRVGEEQLLPLLAEPLAARPVTYDFDVDGQPDLAFGSTLWFAPEGLVRISIHVDGSELDLDLDLTSLIRMEETP